MKTLRRHLLLILVALLGSVVATAQEPDVEFSGPGLQPLEPVLEVPTSRGNLDQTIPNSGFESIGVSGHPVGWTVFGSPAILEESGNRFARVNSTHHYETDIDIPYERRHATISVRARGETGLENGAVRLISFGSPEELYPNKSLPVRSTDWTRVYASFPIFPGYDFFRVVLWSADNTNWIDYDDIIIFGEGIENGGFETIGNSTDALAWQLSSGANIIADSSLQDNGTKALLLPPGGSASKLVGASFDGQEYFVSGRAYANTGGGVLQIQEQWLAASGATLTPSETSMQVGELPASFLWESGNRQSAEASIVTFTNTGATDVVLDVLGRGFAATYPKVYYSDPEDPLVQFDATWPSRLSAGSVTLRDEANEPVATFPLGGSDSGSAYAAVDLSQLEPGNYAAEFALTDVDADSVILNQSLTIIDAPPLAEPAPVSYTDIRRIAWIWLFDVSAEVASIQPYFEHALQDGFNYAVVFDFTSDVAANIAAAENAGIPVFVGLNDISNRIRAVPTFNQVTRHDLETQIAAELEPALDSPMYRGFYLVDEPVAQYQVRRAQLGMSISAMHPEWKEGLVVVAPSPNYLTDLTTIKPSSFGLDYYNSHYETVTACEENYRQVIARVGETMAAARNANRELWYVFQAFTDPYSFRLPNETSVSTLPAISLSLGAKGYASFVHRSVNQFEGVRGRFGETNSSTATMQQQNALVSALESDLIDLHDHAIVPSSGPVHVTMAENSAGEKFFFLVSLDCFNPIQVTLAMQQAAGALTDQFHQRTINFHNGTIDYELAPGEWLLLASSGPAATSASATVLQENDQIAALPVLTDKIVFASPIHDIEFIDGTQQLALAARSRLLMVNRQGTILANHQLYNVMRLDQLNGDFTLAADRSLGMYAMRNTFPYQLVPSFVRRFGSSSGVFGDGNIAWLTLQYWGIRRLDVNTDGTAVSRDIAFAESLTETIVGPIQNADHVLFLDMDRAIRSAIFNGDMIDLTAAHADDRLWRAALSPAKTRLAIARMRRGLQLHSLDTSGGIVATSNPSTSLHHVEDVAWLNDSVLVAADVNGDVKIYYVRDDLSLSELATWRHVPRESALITVEADGGTIALGYQDGRLALLSGDAYTTPITPQQAWWMVR